MNGRLVTDSTNVLTRRTTEMVALDSLRECDSPRLSGSDSAHARLLADSDAELPPILVNRKTMRVVDGVHRVAAAMLRGADKIEAEFCDCDDAEAFVLAVSANVAHGRPLTLADRTAAAGRIIASHGHWSDRAIASATGLSHKTVGAIRRRAGGDIPQPATRVGRDGRARPVNAAQGRAHVAELLANRPDASLREIAKAAGVSPATVRDVRGRLRRGDDLTLRRRHASGPTIVDRVPDRPVPERPAANRLADYTVTRPAIRDGAPTNGDGAPATRDGGSATRPAARDTNAPAAPAVAGATGLVHDLRRDPSLRFSESGRALLRMLDACAMGSGGWTRIADHVPAHCAEIVATAARECSRVWEDFAVELEQRQRRLPAD